MDYKKWLGNVILFLLWVIVICLAEPGFTQSAKGTTISKKRFRHVKLDDSRTVEVADGFDVIRPTIKSENETNEPPSKFSSGQVIVLQDGRLLLIFPNSKKLEATLSSDEGKTWTKPKIIADGSDRPAVVQTKSGTIWAIFYKWGSYDMTKKGSRSNLYVISSKDGGITWSSPRMVWRGYTGKTQGMIETRDGTLVMPFCYLEEPTLFLGACVYSNDGGKTWQYTDKIDIGKNLDLALRQRGLNGGTLEPSVVQLKDGRLFMVIRTVLGRLWSCYSKDDGVTWNKPEPMDLTCGGPVYITRLRSGRLAMVWNEANWNNAEAKRWGFPYGYGQESVAVSGDEGETWSDPLIFAKNKRAVHSLVVDLGKGELLFTMWGKAIFLRCQESQLLKRS